MKIRLVGIDCATKDEKVGVAFGEFRDGLLDVFEAFACTKEKSAANRISAWIANGTRPALLSIDAPLGWPQKLALVLAKHRAGEALDINAHDMFRRATDRFVQKELKKTPLDVGADRIARAAHSALQLLVDLRRGLSLPIPLAWTWPPTEHVSAIEVYPAATLRAYDFRSGGYKKQDQIQARTEIIDSLATVAQISPVASKDMIANADALDATVCLLAAKDFLIGKALPPQNLSLAEVEGWIWTRPLP